MLNPTSLDHQPELAMARTLPSVWYTDPDALAIERQRLFGSTWQYAGPAAKVARPNSFVTMEIAGEPIVVVRDEGGKLRAFYNVCRHRGGPVATGEGSLKVFKCAYHGWLYGQDGGLRTTPEFQGVACFERGDYGLKAVGVAEFGPLLFVHLGDGKPSFADVFGAIPAETARLPLGEMSFFRRVTYEIECNWKVYVDNFLEGYHIPQVHLGLLKEIDYPSYRTECFRYYSKQHTPLRNRPDSLFRKSVDAGAAPEALYYWVFPNIMLNFYPDNLQVNAIIPLSEHRTATVFEWYLAPGAAEAFQASFEFSDTVQKEDVKICELVQKGLTSRSYDTGRYSVQREAGVHHFHGLYCEAMRQGV